MYKEFEIGYSLNHPSICRTWHFREHPTAAKGSQDVSKEDIDRLMQTASDLFE